jgi:hypothetical protein
MAYETPAKYFMHETRETQKLTGIFNFNFISVIPHFCYCNLLPVESVGLDGDTHILGQSLSDSSDASGEYNLLGTKTIPSPRMSRAQIRKFPSGVCPLRASLIESR